MNALRRKYKQKNPHTRPNHLNKHWLFSNLARLWTMKTKFIQWVKVFQSLPNLAFAIPQSVPHSIWCSKSLTFDSASSVVCSQVLWHLVISRHLATKKSLGTFAYFRVLSWFLQLSNIFTLLYPLINIQNILDVKLLYFFLGQFFIYFTPKGLFFWIFKMYISADVNNSTVTNCFWNRAIIGNCCFIYFWLNMPMEAVFR